MVTDPRESQLEIPRSEDELREEYNQDQAGTIWKVLQYVMMVDRSINERIRARLQQMDPEKYNKMAARETMANIEQMLSRMVEE